MCEHGWRENQYIGPSPAQPLHVKKNPMSIVEDRVFVCQYPIDWSDCALFLCLLYLRDLSSRERREWEDESTPVLTSSSRQRINQQVRRLTRTEILHRTRSGLGPSSH